MTELRVTVAIPFFNEESVLGDAIRSVLAQTFGALELLLVDDGSTDGSLAVARSFDDPRITVLADGERRRLPARLNQIIDRPGAPLLARMDADDVMHPRRLAEEVRVLDADPSCDVVGTHVILVDDDGVPLRLIEPPAPPHTLALAMTTPLLSHPTVLARRGWLAKHRYDETLSRCEDRDLWMRAAGSTKIRVVPEALMCVRISAGDRRFVSDYVVAHRQLRSLYLRYGPGEIGAGRTARLYGGSLARSIVLPLLVRLGLGEQLVARRGRALTAREYDLAREAMTAAQRV